MKTSNAIFTGVYLHYKEVPKETKFEKSIADGIKSRKERLDIITKNKENTNNELFKECFHYSNPDTMIKRLKNVNDEINKNMVNSVNENLNEMKKIIKNVPENKTFKIE